MDRIGGGFSQLVTEDISVQCGLTDRCVTVYR